MIVDVEIKTTGSDVVSMAFGRKDATELIEMLVTALNSEKKDIVIVYKNVSVIQVIDMGRGDQAPSTNTLQ